MTAYPDKHGTLGFASKQDKGHTKPMAANEKQVGGSHYKKGGEEHWDRAWRLKYDPFQYIITKWVERWRDKGGIQDLEKAKHAIDKYLEVVRAEVETGCEPGPEYTNQDRRSPPMDGEPMAVSSYQCRVCRKYFANKASLDHHAWSYIHE